MPLIALLFIFLFPIYYFFIYEDPDKKLDDVTAEDMDRLTRRFVKESPVLKKTVLRKNPIDDFDYVYKKSDSNDLREPLYIDRSVNVSIIDYSGDWIKIRVIDPEWLSYGSGWVIKSYVDISTNLNDVKRKYTIDDVPSDFSKSKYANTILHVSNNISKYDSRCREPQIYSTTISPTRSTPGKEVLFMACTTSGFPINVYFANDDFR